MLKRIKMSNIGPAPAMDLDLSPRLNILTGDNGLGKSFILDIAWWALTRKWPAEINPLLSGGKKALPLSPGKASIDFTITGNGKEETYESLYMRREQAWTGKSGRPANPGLVLYAMSDGSFAVWDPARNFWRTQNGVDVQERRPAYVFNPTEVWDGLMDPGGGWISNGLIRDWAGWQKENGTSFESLKEVLAVLSPSARESIDVGGLTRISLDDVRDMPTIRMPYQQDVPVVHASSSIRRIIALAYFLVWAWDEHGKAARQLDEPVTDQVVFLVDEIEAHLHPSRQRRIVPSLLKVMGKLAENAKVQIVTATHSPLVMASVELLFDNDFDAWFDLAFDDNEKGNPIVKLTKRPFVRQGDVSNWLMSRAFDLRSARSLEAESVLEEASIAISCVNFDSDKAKQLDSRLREVLGDTDPFWVRWRFMAEKKGWLS